MKAPSETNIILSSSLIISASEARKLLGVDAKGRSDDEISRDILELTEIAQILIKTSNTSNLS